MKSRLALPVLAGALVAGFALAQNQTSGSTQTSSSSQGSASSTARAGGSASGSGSKSTSAQAGGSQSGTAGGKYRITKPTHAIFYSVNPVGGSRTAQTAAASLWADQKKYYEMLDRQGNLLYAGPWADGNGAMLLVRCSSDQEAQTIADEDPVVKTLLYVANVRAWNVTAVGRAVVQFEGVKTGGQ